jgi:hypothetical protein
MNIEYSRLLFKRSAQAGVVPTINTGSTFPDDTWASTDIIIGEGFINTVDDRMWIRTDNGIVEFSLSGISSANYFTTGATLVGNTLVFDRNDLLSAYTVDLSTLAPTGTTSDSYWTSGSTGTNSIRTNTTGNLSTGNYSLAAGFETSATTLNATALGSQTIASGQHSMAINNRTDATGTASFSFGSDTVASGLASAAGGQESKATADYSFAFGYQNLASASGAVVLGGQGITGSTADTVYVPKLNIHHFNLNYID